jgi:hypothetical protein
MYLLEKSKELQGKENIRGFRGAPSWTGWGLCLMEKSTRASSIFLMFDCFKLRGGHVGVCRAVFLYGFWMSYIPHNDFSAQSNVNQNFNLSINVKHHPFPTFHSAASLKTCCR